MTTDSGVVHPAPTPSSSRTAEPYRGHCQRKVARTEFSAADRELGRPELTPLGESSTQSITLCGVEGEDIGTGQALCPDCA